ncbi:MAG: hypothetical protein KGJ34_01825 [Patescibacteria group bacterium]|nr:hypothetical protein [Patescibacteria group bacterium]
MHSVRALGAGLFSSVALLAFASVLLGPGIASAQYYPYPYTPTPYYGPSAQLVITTQTASGTTLPPSTTVTVTAPGASLSTTPSGNPSISYGAAFTGDTHIITYVPGNYSVSAAPVSGYTYTYSPGCTGVTPSGGGAATCTVTASNYAAGGATLTVYVSVNNIANNYPYSNNSCGNSYPYYPNYYGGNCYNNYNSYTPSNFSISVSGSSPSPAVFQGSSSGTAVTLGPGSYAVTASNVAGYSVSESGACSGNMQTGESLSCTVTYAGSGYGSPYTSVPLSCSAASSEVGLGQEATFYAQGGIGTYTWATSQQTYQDIGPTLNTVFLSSGTQTAVVSSGGETASCSTTVTPGYVAPNIPPPPSGTYYPPVSPSSVYVAPGLPNTGYAPQSGAGIAFALIAILAASIFAYPYVRKAFAFVLS